MIIFGASRILNLSSGCVCVCVCVCKAKEECQTSVDSSLAFFRAIGKRRACIHFKFSALISDVPLYVAFLPSTSCFLPVHKRNSFWSVSSMDGWIDG